MNLADLCWTPLGVRLRAWRRRPGQLNWLFFPGGPGYGSESLVELVDALELPGTCWLVDLPGDGSNVSPPGAPRDPYVLWPQVLLEAVDAVPNPVCVGHATGGQYLLSVPELDRLLSGLVLVSSAPDAGWLPTFDDLAWTSPLPGVTLARARYEDDPSADHLRRVAVESAPWMFTSEGVVRGSELLARLPYTPDAAVWSAGNFERSYVATWWPSSFPTLILSGAVDRVVNQTLWDDPYYRGDHVSHLVIPGAGHWPWIEQPEAIRAAFADFTALIVPSRARAGLQPGQSACHEVEGPTGRS